MSDILVRGIPAHVVAALDANARRAGLSRTEYMRRLLKREALQTRNKVTVDALHRIGAVCFDLQDPDVMSSAWS